MAERRDFISFSNECGGIVQGYGLRAGQEMPETYDELLEFMADRLDIDERPMSIEGLTRWLMRADKNPDSCSPATDTRHAEAVVLIGDLPDPDGYVATLPQMGEMMLLPPSHIIRQLLADAE